MLFCNPNTMTDLKDALSLCAKETPYDNDRLVYLAMLVYLKAQRSLFNDKAGIKSMIS